jgi:hypothetical protein
MRLRRHVRYPAEQQISELDGFQESLLCSLKLMTTAFRISVSLAVSVFWGAA